MSWKDIIKKIPKSIDEGNIKEFLRYSHHLNKIKIALEKHLEMDPKIVGKALGLLEEIEDWVG